MGNKENFTKRMYVDLSSSGARPWGRGGDRVGEEMKKERRGKQREEEREGKGRENKVAVCAMK
jgi:hypothetical protein